MNIKSGSVVALVLPNLPETPIAFLGCLEAGIIVTTVNPIYTSGTIIFFFNSIIAVIEHFICFKFYMNIYSKSFVIYVRHFYAWRILLT